MGRRENGRFGGTCPLLAHAVVRNLLRLLRWRGAVGQEKGRRLGHLSTVSPGGAGAVSGREGWR